MNIVQRATQLAIEYHAGAVNKHDGEVYLLHVHRVSQSARRFAASYGADQDLAEATGWLHDVVEDTVCGIWDIEKALMGYAGMDSVVRAVHLLTKKKGESNEDYYRAILQDDLARTVKLADMTDNFRRNHAIVDPDTRLRMAAKYSLGMDILS